MRAALPLILALTAQLGCAAWVRAHPPDLLGRWRVDFDFADGSRHALRFEARAAGEGSFLLLDPRSSMAEEAEPSEARWSREGERGMTFSGAVEFPVGNVGRDPGTLVFTGTFDTEDLIKGSVAFFRAGQDLKDPRAVPSKNGTFRATRVTSSDAPR